jgi:ligand-binding sensor domain-containing protein/signal transduction histidine kinase
MKSIRRLCIPFAVGLILLAGCASQGAKETPDAWESAPVTAPLAAAFAPAAADPASTIRFDRITGEDGLSQNVVLTIAQDRRGFMWFGTEDGLNKYNGYTFTIYKHDPDNPTTLSDNFVSVIYEDRAGDLWVGTRNGLNRLDRATGTFVRYEHDPDDAQSIGGTWIVSLCEDREGVLWVGTDDGGLDRFDRANGTVVHYRHDPDDPTSLSDDSVGAIYEDRQGALWVGTDAGLDLLDRETGTFTRFQNRPGDQHSLGGAEVSAITEDQTGRLWVGTEDGGLSRFDRASGAFERYRQDDEDPHSLIHNRVKAVFEDNVGRLWVGTQNGLDLYDADRDRFVHYQNDPGDPSSLSSNAVWSVYEDRTGVLWFGTYGGGLSKYNRITDQFVLYQHRPDLPGSLSDDMVWAIHEDEDDILWIGTFNGGLNRLDREAGELSVYRHDPEDAGSLGSDDVRAILEDRMGVLWVGTGGGLDRLDRSPGAALEEGAFAHYRHDADDPTSLSENRVSVLLEDSRGDLWVGTRTGGLNRFDRETGAFVRYQHDTDDPTSLSSDRVWALYEDAVGKLWVGTLGGVSVWNPDTDSFTRYLNNPDDSHSLSNDAVFAFHEDAEGTMWVGTWGSGLDRFDPQTQTFDHYTEKDGLANNVIYGIEADRQGNLWMSTNKGLSKFDPRTETFHNYDVRDGLQDNEFNVGAHFASPNGELFFGGVRGFNAFYPQRVTGNPHAPPVVITAFGKFNQVVRRDLELGEHIALSYQEDFIFFEFAALDYAAPDKNRYAYMLEGQDETWVNAGMRRHVDYTNLRGGNYVFRVRGSNNDGVWNEEGTFVTLTVTPPFWETWWFRGSAILLLAAVIGGGYWLRVRGVEARSRELERQVEERTHEIEQLYERAQKLAVIEERQRLARDLYDAVTQTLFSASLIAEVLPRIWERDPEEGQRRLAEVRELTRGALAEMRTLLLELRPSALADAELGDLLRQLAEATTGRARMPVTVQIEGACASMPLDVKVALYRIAQEALNNVAKHSDASRATVRLRCSPPSIPPTGGEEERGGVVELHVADDGRGFDVAAIPPDHLGVGIMRERAEAIEAKLTVDSEPGRGTKVSVVWGGAEHRKT